MKDSILLILNDFLIKNEHRNQGILATPLNKLHKGKGLPEG